MLQVHLSASALRSNQRGSALLLSMTLAMILMGSVTAMLYAVNAGARSTSDKLAFEETYHCAMSGLAAAKYWIIHHGAPAKVHLGNTLGTKVDAISSGSVDLSNYVRDNANSTVLLNGLTTAKILEFFTAHDSAFAAGELLPGGRRVLCDLGGPNTKLIRLRRDAPTMSMENVFSGENNIRTYLRNLRFTTPYRNVDGYKADDLREVSIIVEATAVTEGMGRTKVRTLQQKLLIVPTQGDNSNPILGPVAGVAFGGGAVTVQGSSSLNVRWGPVWSKSQIQLLQLSLNHGSQANSIKTLTAGGTGNSKFFGAGVMDGTMLEKWNKYHTAGVITDTNGNPIFRDSASTDANNPRINGVPVTDFFVQVMNGDFGANWTKDRLSLGGQYKWTSFAGEWAQAAPPENITGEDITGENILYDKLKPGETRYTTGTGAFLQRDVRMIEKVNNLINSQLDYNTWKNVAIANSSYLRPSGSNFVNAEGQLLYVTPTRTLTTISAGNSLLTSLNQLSMAGLIPADGNTINLGDRVLFVDTPSGTENGALSTVSIGSSFFWKGLLYVQGNISTSGVGASQSVLMKNPDEFKEDPTGTKTGARRGSCYLDGVMLVAGTLSRQGNGCIYGSLVAKGGYAGGGSPDIYYNSRNAGGLFKEVVQNQQIAQIVTGPTSEI